MSIRGMRLQKTQKRAKTNPAIDDVSFVFFARFVAIHSRMKVVVLCSGGMDSVTALHWANRAHVVAAALSFDYGSKHNHREIPCAADQAKQLGVPHEIIALDFVNRFFASDLLKSGGAI